MSFNPHCLAAHPLNMHVPQNSLLDKTSQILSQTSVSAPHHAYQASDRVHHVSWFRQLVIVHSFSFYCRGIFLTHIFLVLTELLRTF